MNKPIRLNSMGTPIRSNKAWRELYEATQAKLDRLMMEFCPEEMTKEQLLCWEKSQKPVKEFHE